MRKYLNQFLEWLDNLYLKLFTPYNFRTTDGKFPCPNENMTDLQLYYYEEKVFWHEPDRTWASFKHFLERKNN